jgi:hypothetical protein
MSDENSTNSTNEFQANPVTHLDSTISNIPWGDAFEIGSGVNAVTGEVMASAIEKPSITDKETKASHTNYRFIKNENDLEQEIEVSAKGKYNIEGVTLSASSSYLNKIKFSATSVSLIAHYESYYSGYDLADKYVLTDQAREIINDHDKFRAAYGDYFVAGRRRGATFTAVYRCETTSAERLDKFMASFGADAPEVFSAEGSTKFEKSAKENNVSLSIYIDMNGYSVNPPSFPTTPEGIIEALNWFRSNEKGVPIRAELFHYSHLDPNFSPDVPVAPDIFVSLSQLYSKRWKIMDAWHSIPAVYNKKYDESVNKFNNTVMANSNELAVETVMRDTLQREADSLYNALNDVVERQAFYFEVQEKISTEPKKGDQTQEKASGPHIWLYGFDSYNKSDAVTIDLLTLNYDEEWHIGHREHTFEFGPDGKYMIVGWKVKANWNDGTDGEWDKAIDQILLTNHGAVHVYSQYDRGCSWTCIYYFVSKADYEFG